MKQIIIIILCLSFNSCELKEFNLKHNNKIDSIQVVTIQNDTVWIFADTSGYIRIVPNDYRCK